MVAHKLFDLYKDEQIAHKDKAPYFSFNLCRQVPVDYLFKGQYHLTVEVPPEPYTIYWDNLHSSAVNKILFSVTLLFFVLIMYVILIYLTITL